jgi:dipeptidyl aminopeptidase/acylaminoacyl peptidase
MNWLKSQLVKLIARHAANAAGAWFVSKGFLTNDDTDKLYGALAVLLAIAHSLWDKRALIVAEIKHLADGGKLPLLLVHGEDDANPGTEPFQSRKLYQAIRGNGGTTRLVMLPNEPHWYTALESNEQLVSEMLNWFDTYVKNAK